MNKFIRMFNRNQKIIIFAIIGILFLVLILQALNSFSKKEQEKEKTNNVIRNNLTRSSISDEEMTESIYNYNKNVIEEFTEYCNSGDIKSAYDLLSSDCKNLMFDDLEKFKDNYYKKVFSSNKKCTVQYWADNIFEVKFAEDMLATGKTSKNNGFTDYIAIDYEDGKNKININGFLGKENINAEKMIGNIKIKVLYKYIFMDYETYSVQIINNRDQTICLDNLNKSGTMYLLDQKDVKHYAMSNEIVKDELIVKSKQESVANIKFNNPYIKDRKINEIVFSNIIIGYTDNNPDGSDILNVDIEINN